MTSRSGSRPGTFRAPGWLQCVHFLPLNWPLHSPHRPSRHALDQSSISASSASWLTGEYVTFGFLRAAEADFFSVVGVLVITVARRACAVAQDCANEQRGSDGFRDGRVPVADQGGDDHDGDEPAGVHVVPAGTAFGHHSPGLFR